MSTSATPTETAECSYCEGDRDVHASVAGSFCSSECHLKHQADKALNVVRNDHRICASCLRFIKQVERPTDDWNHENGSRTEAAIERGAEYHNVDSVGISLDVTDCYGAPRTSVESVIGFQYQTEHAETAVKEFDGPHQWTRIKQTGTACECGNVDPSETVDILQECEPAVVLANYVRTFRRLEAEGKIDSRIDKDVLFSTFRETRDLTLALGRALHE
jgi:hypothetical protein